MSNAIIEKTNNGLFENEIELNGKYGYYIRFLKDEIGAFTTFREVYILSTALGFIKHRNSTPDASEKMNPASVFTDQIRTRKADLKFLYRLIMIVHEESDFTIEDYMNRAFRDGSDENNLDNLKSNMSLFHEYTCGGLEYLYDIFKDLRKPDDIVNALYDLLHDVAIQTGLLKPEGLDDFDVGDLG